MINGEKFLVGGRNLSLLLNKLNLKKIPFYDLEYCENKIFITIEKKDCKKFIDLISKTWYYKSIGKTGKSKLLQKLFKRLGLFLGVIIFTASCFCFDNLVLGVTIEADSGFYSDISTVLSDAGANKYALFSRLDLKEIEEQIYAQNPLICYSSVYKRGNTLVVEAQRSNSFTGGVDTSKKSLVSNVDGQILQLVTLRGYPLKKEGDFVKAGEVIVSGEKMEEDKFYSTFVLASAKILCSYTYLGKENPATALLKAQILCGQEEYYSQDIIKEDDKVKITLKYIIEI